MKLTVNVDGGARGNPGPAAIGVVVRDESGERLTTHSETIGEATNNIAEYRALLAGIEQAGRLGADRIEILYDGQTQPVLTLEEVQGAVLVRLDGDIALRLAGKTLAQVDAADFVFTRLAA